MLNQLREKLFAWTLKRQAPRTVRMMPWDKVRSVALLYPSNNVQDIINHLQQANKEVVLFTMPEKEETCALTCSPKRNILQQMSTRQFDLLIDLTQVPNLTMHYLALHVNADFKAGRLARTGIYDLSIDTPSQETPDYLYSQIIKYLQMINA